MTGVADSIKTSTGVVTIDPTPPTTGQVLTTTSPTTAKWLDPVSVLGVNFSTASLVSGDLLLNVQPGYTANVTEGVLTITATNLYSTTASGNLTFNY